MAHAIELIGDRAEQAVGRARNSRPGVEQDKAAGAIGRLDMAGPGSPGRSGRPADRPPSRGSAEARPPAPIEPKSRQCRAPRQHRGGNVEQRQSRVPAPVAISRNRCARRWSRRWRARRRRSIAKAARNRRCRTAAPRRRPWPGRRERGRGSRRSGGGKIGVQQQAGGRRDLGLDAPAAAGRKDPPCAGPARRWRMRSAGRGAFPRPRWSRAGWSGPGRRCFARRARSRRGRRASSPASSPTSRRDRARSNRDADKSQTPVAPKQRGVARSSNKIARVEVVP